MIGANKIERGTRRSRGVGRVCIRLKDLDGDMSRNGLTRVHCRTSGGKGRRVTSRSNVCTDAPLSTSKIFRLLWRKRLKKSPKGRQDKSRQIKKGVISVTGLIVKDF